MGVCERLREIRIQKELTQGDIQQRTGLLRSYVSRIEHGHTTPSVETLEKFARGLEIPIYSLFYGDDEPPALPESAASGAKLFGARGKDQRTLLKFQRLLGQMEEEDRELFLFLANKMTRNRAVE
jgi:transcriptional regulator with XRE-family HTH domain